MDNTTNVVLMETTRGRKKGKTSKDNSCHHHGNWNSNEILVLIDYKQKNKSIRNKSWILEETWSS